MKIITLPDNCFQCYFVDCSWENWEKEGIGFCTILCERVLSHHICKCPEEYYKRKLELEEKKE